MAIDDRHRPHSFIHIEVLLKMVHWDLSRALVSHCFGKLTLSETSWHLALTSLHLKFRWSRRNRTCFLVNHWSTCNPISSTSFFLKCWSRETSRSSISLKIVDVWKTHSFWVETSHCIDEYSGTTPSFEVGVACWGRSSLAWSRTSLFIRSHLRRPRLFSHWHVARVVRKSSDGNTSPRNQRRHCKITGCSF